MRIICLFLLIAVAGRLQAQTIPSNEDFVNDTFLQTLDSTAASYYLITGTDTCRFEKFDYDEWVKYHLQEPVPLAILNELAYKVHLTHEPYYWRQDKLQKAVCITAAKADALIAVPPGAQVFSFSQPRFTDDGRYAVIDINWKYGPTRGGGFTFLYRQVPDGWQRVGFKQNWGGEQ
jgi:hypothetical protein